MSINLTKLQAEELAYRLLVNEESQDNEYPEDRLPVWGKVEGRTLTIWSVDDCLDDIDEIICRWTNYAESGEVDSFGAWGSVRSMESLRVKVTAAA